MLVRGLVLPKDKAMRRPAVSGAFARARRAPAIRRECSADRREHLNTGGAAILGESGLALERLVPAAGDPSVAPLQPPV